MGGWRRGGVDDIRSEIIDKAAFTPKLESEGERDEERREERMRQKVDEPPPVTSCMERQVATLGESGEVMVSQL